MKILGFLITAGISIYWGIIYRFQNPQLTETQLFLGRWYLIIPALLGVCLILKEDSNQNPKGKGE